MNSIQELLQRARELITVGESFDSARWDHWLLLVFFLVISTVGLWLSWQWRKESRKRP